MLSFRASLPSRPWKSFISSFSDVFRRFGLGNVCSFLTPFRPRACFYVIALRSSSDFLIFFSWVSSLSSLQSHFLHFLRKCDRHIFSDIVTFSVTLFWSLVLLRSPLSRFCFPAFGSCRIPLPFFLNCTNKRIPL